MLAHTPAHAATVPPGFSETLVASGLSSPTAMQFAPDGRLFVAEQGGKLRVIKDGASLPTPFVTLDRRRRRRARALGIALRSELRDAIGSSTSTTRRPRADPQSRQPLHGQRRRRVAGSEAVLLDLDKLSGATNHNGGAIALRRRTASSTSPSARTHNGSNAQTPDNLARQDAPDQQRRHRFRRDNPFFGQASGNNRAIWALGLRNPFTFAFQPGTTRMFINDVGRGTCGGDQRGPRGRQLRLAGYRRAGGGPEFNNPLALLRPRRRLRHHRRAFYNPATRPFPDEYWATTSSPTTAAAGFAGSIPQRHQRCALRQRLPSPVDLKVDSDGVGTTWRVDRVPRRRRVPY